MRVTDKPHPSEPKRESDWARRRRLAAVFGEVLPETTENEREPSTPDATDASDAWLEEQVPPHHGGS